MTNHPHRGRIAPDCSTDFTTPCHPDIHSMPKPVRAAGAKIRREIQRRYGAWMEAERTAGQYAKWAGRSSQGDRVSGYKKEIAEEAEAAYKSLFDAYHAWSQTASRSTPYKANPNLLKAVCEAEEVGRL